MTAIDGCSVGCARATLERADVPLKAYLVLTDLGIEKNKNLNPQPEQVAEVKAAVRKAF